jgi:hypothetical protein
MNHLHAQWRDAAKVVEANQSKQWLHQWDGMQSHRVSLPGLILKHGQEFAPAPLEADHFRGPIKACYANAYAWVMNDPRASYCEGYAASSFFPVAHAWVTYDGRTALDPTWCDDNDMEMAQDFFGIAFSRRALTIVEQHGAIFGDMPMGEVREWLEAEEIPRDMLR